jgi:hypothetical protein
VAADGPTAWRRSSACIPSNCVEVASHGREVWIRDSAAPAGPVLHVAGPAWHEFLRHVSGEKALAGEEQ